MANFFFGFRPDQEIKNQLVALSETIKTLNPYPVDFVRPENLPLTMLFLGKLPKEKIKSAKEILTKVGYADSGIFRLEHLTTIGKPTRVIAIQGLVNIDVKQLYEQLTKLSKFYDLEADDTKKFKPHLTLARVKKYSKVITFDFPPFIPFNWRLTNLTLLTAEWHDGKYTYVEV